MASAQTYDDLHQAIGVSINSMRAMHPLFRKVEQTAIAWQRSQQETLSLSSKFYDAVQELADRAGDSNQQVQEMSRGFLTYIETQRQLDIARKDVIRALGDEVILPLTTRIDSDLRTTSRMEKEYDKYTKQYVHEVNVAEKELEKWAKKARKMASDGYSTSNLAAAQANVADRVRDLDNMRRHTIRQCLIEERRRYGTLLNGLLEHLKNELLFFAQADRPMKQCVDTCLPILAGAAPPPRQARPRVAAARGPPTMTSPPKFPSSGLAPGQYRAKYQFKAEEPSQLSLNVGDIIQVDGDSEDNWQYGTNLHSGRTGWFPANYLQRTLPDSVSAFSMNSQGPAVPAKDY